MKKIKRTKPSKKKSIFSKLLLPLIIAVVAFLSISYYYVANYGTGPLSFLVGTPMVALLVEDTGNGIKITQTSSQAANNTGAKVTDTNTGKTVTITNTSKDGSKLDSAIVSVVGNGSGNKLNTITDNAVINASTCTDDKGTGCVSVKTSDIRAASQAQAKADCLARGGTWSDSQGCLNPNAPVTTPVTDTSGPSCPGASSNIGAGQYAQTGRNAESLGGSKDQRECTKCGGGGPGLWGGSYICGAGPATNYITRPDEVIDCKGKPDASCAKASCWANGTWYADSPSSVGGRYCHNGTWVADYTKTKNEECSGRKDGSFYNEHLNSCVKAPTCKSGETLDQANNVCVSSVNNPATTKTCGAGLKLVGNSCMSAADLGRAVQRCEEVPGKLFNVVTGQCGAQSAAVVATNKAVNPALSCGKQTDSKGNVSWVDCTATKEIISIRFCSAGKFDATGNCIVNGVVNSSNNSSYKKVGQECPKDYLSCSGFCDKNSEGKFASKIVNGKIVCDVPPALTVSTPPKTETPIDPASFKNVGTPCGATYMASKNSKGEWTSTPTCGQVCDIGSDGHWKSKVVKGVQVCDVPYVAPADPATPANIPDPKLPKIVDGAPKSLIENTATYDQGDCKYGGVDLSGKYGGTANNGGKIVYECRNSAGSLGTIETVQEPSPSSNLPKIVDAAPKSLLEGTPTYDVGDCMYGGIDLSGKYGGTAANGGKIVYECKNSAGGLGIAPPPKVEPKLPEIVDGAPKSLPADTATYDEGDCKYGGVDLSGKYGGTAANGGKAVYECKNSAGSLGTINVITTSGTYLTSIWYRLVNFFLNIFGN